MVGRSRVGRSRVGWSKVGWTRVGRSRVGWTRVGRTRVDRTRVGSSSSSLVILLHPTLAVVLRAAAKLYFYMLHWQWC